MLRNIPRRAIQFTATWLAGRLFAFKSTGPEIFPSGRHKNESSAHSQWVPCDQSKVQGKLRKRILGIPTRKLDFSAFRKFVRHLD